MVLIYAFFFRIPLVPAAQETRETPVVRAVQKVSPAVVNISSEFEVRYRTNPFTHFSRNPFYDNFFKDFFDRGVERLQKRTSLGSGVLIDGKAGFILTNAHVLAQTGTITATLLDEREFEARIVGVDPDTDLAVLRITTQEPLPAVEMGTSGDLMIGETVIAIGNPFGFSHTVTTGVISALNRSIRSEDRVYNNFIQLDASINPGNSGGPLLNINGDLIGINTAIYARAQGIGFAIPIDTARKIISDLIKFGEVIPAWIGLTVQNLDPNLARYMKIPDSMGVVVQDVHPAGPARKAGIQPGDVIRSIGSQSVGSTDDYRDIMKKHAEGDSLDLRIWRDGSEWTQPVRAAVFPPALAMDLAYRILGIRVENLKTPNRADLQSPGSQGVVITEVRDDAYLASIGAAPGDVIRRIDETTINDTSDFKRAIVKYRHKKSMVILLFRGQQGYYITIEIS